MAQKQFKIGLSNTDKQNMAQDVYERVLALTFPEYDTTTEYEVGDFVVYNDQLYKCIGATSGAWDSTKWQLATLNDLVTDIENAVAFVNDKANVNGNYPTMTVGFADNLTPYDESAGDDQDEPFSFQATGTGNGTQPDFSTGSGALMKEKQGNTVVVNQLAKELNTANWGIYGATGSITDGVLSMTATEEFGRCAQVDVPVIANHKYFMSCDMYLTSDTNDVSLNLYYADKALKPLTSGWHHLQDIVTVSTSGDVNLRVIDSRSSAWDEIKAKNIVVVDLTQWFGSNDYIPPDLLAHPENFFRYYQGSLAYNEGTLVNSNGRYLKAIGRNQWDEVAEQGRIVFATGENASGNGLRSKNYIKVIPNQVYHQRIGTYDGGTSVVICFYDKDKNFVKSEEDLINGNFTVPSNACYIRFSVFTSSAVTYNHDVTISLYYEDETGYDQYYPYEELANNDTGTEVLRSAGSVKDYKTSDGTITRRIGVVDLGSLEWVRAANDNGYMFVCVSGSLNDMKPNSNYTTTPSNFLSSKYISKTYNYVYYGLEDKIISPYEDQTRVAIINNDYTDAAAFKTAMSGIYLFYELATPTTEQGTPYSENLVIDDFGSMDFGSDVPQGALIFYPVDYKAFIDTLYKYTDGTPSNVALKSDLPTAPQTWAESLPGYDATKTQTLKNVEGTLTWVDDE